MALPMSRRLSLATRGALLASALCTGVQLPALAQAASAAAPGAAANAPAQQRQLSLDEQALEGRLRRRCSSAA